MREVRSVDSEAEPRLAIHAFSFSNHYKFTETCYYSKLHHSEVSEKAFAGSCYRLFSFIFNKTFIFQFCGLFVYRSVVFHESEEVPDGSRWPLQTYLVRNNS